MKPIVDTAYTPEVKKLTKELITSGVIAVVIENGVLGTEMYRHLVEVISFPAGDNYTTGRLTDTVVYTSFLKKLMKKYELRISVMCKAGCLEYAIVESDKKGVLRAALSKITRGQAMASETIDVESIPHRFQNTRFHAIVASTVDGYMGKTGGVKLHGFNEYALGQTLGRVVIVGRKTYEDLGLSEVLTQRMVYVLSADENYKPRNAFRVGSVQEFLSVALDKFLEVPAVYILGGKKTYEAFAPLISHWTISRFDTVLGDEGDKEFLFNPITNYNDWIAKPTYCEVFQTHSSGKPEVHRMSRQNLVHRRFKSPQSKTE